MGKVRGRESSDWGRLSGTHFGWGLGFLEEIDGVWGGGFGVVAVVLVWWRWGRAVVGEGGLGLFIVSKGFNECIDLSGFLALLPFPSPRM